MKTKTFFSRIVWDTSQLLRKSLTSLKALTLLLVMVISVNVWGATTKTIIIDGSKLTGTATTAAADYTYGDFTITMSDGAKSQSSSGDNKFADNAILIGKSGKYIYNKTPFGKKITKFELYANKGASTKVSVGVLFSTTAISAYATGTNTYTATLSTVDKVYDCSSKIPEGAKYFWYQVTNANNSQVMFRVTYEEEEEDPTKPSLSVDPEEIDFGTVEQNAAVPAGQDVEVTFENLTTNDVTASISGDFNINKTGSFTSGDKITVTPKSTATIGTIEGTLTIKATTDDITKTVPVTMTVAAPEVGVSFEKATSAYTDWTFTNFASQQTHSDVKAHTGAYFGTTGGKESGSMVTKAKIAKPGTLQFFISKTTTNTTSSNWKVSVSTDNSSWTQVGENISATSVTKGQWTEVNVDLKSYTNVYVKIEYAGSSAVRCIDDVVFIAPQSYNVTLATNPASVGTITAKVNDVEIGAQVEEGQTVTLSATPNDAHAYRFKEWQSDDVTIENNAFEMPNKAVSITAVFEQLYAVSLTTTGEGSGTATINGVTETIYVGANDVITLFAEAATGSEFKCWSTTEGIVISGDETKTAKASADGTITATFNKKECTILDTPQNVQVTDKTYSGAKLTWDAVANAYSYEVTILRNNETIESGIVTNEEYTTSTTLSANTEYSYSIVATPEEEGTYCSSVAAEGVFTTADYPAVVLTLSENGSTSTKDGKLNTPIELPTTSTQACDGKVFVGWSATEIEGEVGKDQVSLLDATYTFNDPAVLEKTIYAVYAKKVEGDKYFEKVSSAPSDWCGKYLIVYETGKLAMNGSLETLDAVGNSKSVTISDSKIAWSAEMEAITFTVAYKTGSSTVYSLKSASGKYISGTTTSAAASNGIKQADTDANYEISFNGLTIESKSSDQQMVLKYNKASDQTRFRFYKSGQEVIAMYKYSATIDYSNYCTTCQAAVVAPTFDPDGGKFNSEQSIELTAPEGDIYYTINDGTETKYEEAIKLENRGTYEISAYAKVNDRTSETVTKTYTLDWAYTLAELVDEGAPTTAGRTVTVILTDEVIESIVTSGSYTNGFYTMVGDKKIEVYCQNSPATWKEGGKVSGTVTCPWKDYKGTWELCPADWKWVTNYTAPVHITSIAISGELTYKDYSDGQQPNPAGLVVTGFYSDHTEQVPHTEVITEGLNWILPTLEEGATTAMVSVKYTEPILSTELTSEEYQVTINPVTPAKTLESIYVADDSEHKKTFFVGRPFSAEGLKVMAKYNIGEDQPIAVANLTITNTTFSEAEEEHTINISYTENDVEKTTSYNVEVKYMNLSDLVAEDLPEAGTSVKVVFSDVEITGFYTNKSEQRAGVYVNVKGKNEKNIELYYSSPSTDLDAWQEGGLLATKDAYVSGTWSYYSNGDVWEITFGSGWDWDANLTYTAPEIYPTAIELSETTATVKQSKSLDLEASFTPANATVLNNLEWSSDNNQVTVAPSQDKKSAIVTVDPDATVGTATITVKVDDKDGNKLSATCVITIEEYSVPHYGLYNGAISEGNYIFKADGEYYFMNNTISSSRLTNVADADDPDIVNNVITTDAEAYVWHIAKSGDYWTIQNLANSKYAAGTGTKNQAQLLDACTDDMAKWTITYDEAKDVYTFENLGRSKATSYSDNKYLRNNDGNGWACYASGTGNAITLYKAGFTPAAALQSIEIKGDLEITEYFQGKSVKYDGLTVEGTYSDGDKKTITEGIVWSASPASFSDLGAQTVTITATVTTKSGDVMDDAEFNVTVVESQQVNYGLVTNVNTLYDGATIILGAVFGTDATPIYAVNQGFYSKYLEAYRSNDPNGSDLEYADEVMKTAFASEITLKKAEGGWKLMDENNNYIKSNNADIALTDKADEATVWTISIEDGVTKIASGYNVICYNTSSPRFKTYTETSQSVINCSIYMKNLVAIRTGLTAGKIGTICYPQAIAAVDGANLYQPNYKDDAVKNIYFSTPDEYSAGLPMIFQADREIMKVLFTGNVVEDPIDNMEITRGMVGSFEHVDIENNGKNFIFSNNKLYLAGENCWIDSNRAYIDLSQVPFSDGQLSHDLPGGAPRKTISLGNASASTPTNLNGLNGNIKAQKVMKDGQFYIIREAKMYNAQGIKVQ